MADIKGIITARLKAYDPTLDTSPGGAVDVIVIQPIVKALSSDPTLASAKDFLKQKFNEGFPDYPLAEGDAINDILINALSLFLEPYRLELERIRKSQSVSFFDQMSEDELDNLAANWLVYRRNGTRAFGTVRVVVNRLAPITVDRTILFTAKNGSTFVPSLTYTVSSAILSGNSLPNNLYFLDIDITANSVGFNGNIGANEIVSVTGIPSVVSLTNSDGFIGGADSDTNEMLSSARLVKSITERSLVTTRGIVAKIDSSIPDVRATQVIGFADPEMTRDDVLVEGYGDYVSTGVAYFEGNICILNTIKDVRNMVSGDIVLDQANSVSYKVLELLGKSESPLFLNSGKTYILKLDRDEIYTEYCSYVTLFSEPSVTLSGETFYNTANIGGKTDIYISPNTETFTTTNIPINNDEYLANGTGLSIQDNLIILDVDLSKIDLTDKYIAVQGDIQYTAQVYSYSFQNGKTRILTNVIGPNAVSRSAQWFIVEWFTVPLTETKSQVYPSQDTDTELTVQFTIDSNVANTNIDLTATKVKPGDLISIKYSSGIIDHQITAISPFKVSVQNKATETTEKIPCTVVRPKAALPIPTATLESVSLNSNIIPYAKLLGVESDCFGGAESNQSGQGFVSGSLHYAIKASFSQDDADFLTSLKNSTSGVLTYVQSRLNNSEPFNLDINLSEGSSILSFKSADNSKSSDVIIPSDLLIPSTDNIFIALGDTLSERSDDNYPINAVDGDILEILDGENRGNYIIQQVYNIRIPNTPDGSRFTTQQGLSKLNVNRTQGSMNKTWRMISVVRIYGSFKSNLYGLFDESFVIPFTKSTVNVGPDVFVKRIYDISRLSSIFTNQASLISESSLSTRIKSKLTSLQISSGINVQNDAIGNIDGSVITDAVFSNSMTRYRVGKPAVGDTYLIAQNETDALLPSYHYVPYTLENIKESMKSNTVIADNKMSIFHADYKGMSIIVKPNEYSSPIQSVKDVYDPTTWPAGIVGSAVNVTVPSNVIYSRYARSFDRPKLDSIAISKSIVSSSKNDELWVLTENHVFNSTIPSVKKTFIGYIPCLLDPDEIPVGYLTRAQLNAELQNISAKNHAGLTPRQMYDLFTDTTIPYAFKLITEDQYKDTDYINTLNTSNGVLSSYPIDAYFYEIEFEYEKGGLALGSCVSGSNILYYENQFASINDGSSVGGMKGKYLKINSGLNQGIYTITDVNETQRSLYVDKIFTQTSVPISARGIAFYDPQSGDLKILGSIGSQISDVGANFIGEDYEYEVGGVKYSLNSGVSYGVTSRYLNLDDINKYITLYSFVKNDNDYTNQSFGQIRENIGCYKISSINTLTRNSPTMGADVVVKQDIQAGLPQIHLLFGGDFDVTTLIPILFVLTDNPTVSTEVFEDGNTSISTLCAFQIFNDYPTKYRIAAVHESENIAYICGIDSPTAPSSRSDNLFVKIGESNNNYTLDRNNPITISRPGAKKISISDKMGGLLQARLEMQSLGCNPSYNNIAREVFVPHNENINGYELFNKDASVSFSSKEKLYLKVKPIVNDTATLDQTLQIGSYTSNVVNTVQGMVDDLEDRIVCSDTLVKRMLPGFIGIYAEYYRGPSVDIAINRIITVLRNLSYTSLSESTIIRELQRMGAFDVVLPIKIYLVIEDRSRNRHYRLIKNVLKSSNDLYVDGTTRIIAKEVATYNSNRLGATIEMTRLVDATNLGQGD